MSAARRLDEGLERGTPCAFLLDGETIPAFSGETVAAALMAAGRQALRHTARRDEPRGYYCGMGVCWECALWVEGRGIVQACKLRAAPGLVLRTLRGAGPR